MKKYLILLITALFAVNQTNCFEGLYNDDLNALLAAGALTREGFEGFEFEENSYTGAGAGAPADTPVVATGAGSGSGAGSSFAASTVGRGASAAAYVPPTKTNNILDNDSSNDDIEIQKSEKAKQLKKRKATPKNNPRKLKRRRKKEKSTIETQHTSSVLTAAVASTTGKARKVRVFICKNEKCKQKFTRTDHFIEHMEHHTNAKDYPHQCNICGVGCGKKSNLTKHRTKVHGLIIPKETNCSECNENFKKRQSLSYHMLHHTNAASYPIHCDICGAGYMGKPGITQHKRKAHNISEKAANGKTKCLHPDCKETFKDTYVRNQHMDHHNHPEKYSKICNICGAGYNHAISLTPTRYKKT